jgi:hypothetical protein
LRTPDGYCVSFALLLGLYEYILPEEDFEINAASI